MLDLDPPTFVHRLGYENITRTSNYLKGFDEDLEMHPIPEPTCQALAAALEVPVRRVRAATSESYRRLAKGCPPGLTPHANIILHPREGPPIRGFTAMRARVDTMIPFIAYSHTDTFVKQAVKALKGRDLRGRKLTSAEPVFGQIKEALSFRQFLLRGHRKAQGEWSLICMANNILKLMRPGWSPKCAAN